MTALHIDPSVKEFDSKQSSGQRTLDSLSDDVARRVLHLLSVKERARFSSLNKRLNQLFFTWDDVFHCSARLGSISLAGEDFVVDIEKSIRPDSAKGLLDSALNRCPMIRKLAIHDEHLLRDIDPKLIEQATNIDELHLPSGLFGRFTYTVMIEAFFSLPKLQTLHIQQRYNDEKRHVNILHPHHVECLTSTTISNVKLQGITVTSSALEALSEKYAMTMSTLCLIGSLAHTQHIDVYFRALRGFERLSSLSLPPSLYSISPSNSSLFSNHRYPSIRNLHSLRRVALFVSKPDMDQLRLAIGLMLPPTLEHLVLYDDSYRLSLRVLDEFKNCNMKIHFCGDYDCIVDSYWTNGRSELITQTIWKPPYLPYTVIQPTLPEWYCLISDLMDTAVGVESSDRSGSLTGSTTTASAVRRDNLQSSAQLHTASTPSSQSLAEVTARSDQSATNASSASNSESDNPSE